MTTEAQTKTYTLIIESGSDISTSRVALTEAYQHVVAGDKLSDEARCLLAWYHCSEVKTPLAWDSKRGRLIFKEEDVQPEFVTLKVKYVE